MPRRPGTSGRRTRGISAEGHDPQARGSSLPGPGLNGVSGAPRRRRVDHPGWPPTARWETRHTPQARGSAGPGVGQTLGTGAPSAGAGISLRSHRPALPSCGNPRRRGDQPCQRRGKRRPPLHTPPKRVEGRTFEFAFALPNRRNAGDESKTKAIRNTTPTADRKPEGRKRRKDSRTY